MSEDYTQTVQRAIAAQTRIRDELPELVPTSLARELTNNYPAEVPRNSHRLASLAAEILRRERQTAADERAARHRESRQLRDQVERLQTELIGARRAHDELERRAAGAATDFGKRMAGVVDRVKRFRKRTQASKRSLLADITRLAGKA
jgi:hypothetical protein